MTAIFNKLAKWITDAINGILAFFPDSPFQFDVSPEFLTAMGYLNYFIPIGSMLRIMQAWLTCITIWYASLLILRWIKAIE